MVFTTQNKDASSHIKTLTKLHGWNTSCSSMSKKGKQNRKDETPPQNDTQHIHSAKTTPQVWFGIAPITIILSTWTSIPSSWDHGWFTVHRWQHTLRYLTASSSSPSPSPHYSELNVYVTACLPYPLAALLSAKSLLAFLTHSILFYPDITRKLQHRYDEQCVTAT